MSANRANASARNRRAGGAEMPPPQQQQNSRPIRPGQQQSVPLQQQNPKISFGDAVGLVSLRVGRLEQFMYKINHEGLGSSSDLNLGENDRIVDEDVFRSIVSRLEALEKENAYANVSQVKEVSIDNHPVINTLNEKYNALQLSIYEVKDMILKMQAFAMETSTSLKGLIEQYESDKAYNEQLMSNYNSTNIIDYQDESFCEPSEVIDDNQLIIDGNSLKEIIKKELSTQL
jgi:hypothetical protein